jgi:hypothetical protein
MNFRTPLQRTLSALVFSYFVTRYWSKWHVSVDYYGTSVPNRTEETRMLYNERGMKNISKMYSIQEFSPFQHILLSKQYWSPLYKDNQCTCNLTLRRVRVNNCRGKAIIITYCECVFVAFYPVSNVHVPYCDLWPLRLCNTFPHYLINGTTSEKRYWTQNVFWFSPQLLSEKFSHSKKNSAIYYHQCTYFLM